MVQGVRKSHQWSPTMDDFVPLPEDPKVRTIPGAAEVYWEEGIPGL